ncbi:uncharacterized protein METZ01_LOCUS434259, partial [marine metagenome]
MFRDHHRFVFNLHTLIRLISQTMLQKILVIAFGIVC